LVKDNNCSLCGKKLMSRGKIIQSFSTMDFSKEGAKKANLKPICSDCASRLRK